MYDEVELLTLVLNFTWPFTLSPLRYLCKSGLFNIFLGNCPVSVFLGFYVFVWFFFLFLAGETNFIPEKCEETLKVSHKTIIKENLWLRSLVNFFKFADIKIHIIFETVRHNAKVQPDVDRAEWGEGTKPFPWQYCSCKTQTLESWCLLNKNRSMKAQRWNKVCSDLGWLCMLLQSYLAEHRGVGLCSAERIAFSLLPCHDWDLLCFLW